MKEVPVSDINKGMYDDIYKYEEEIENFPLEKIREDVYKKLKKNIIVINYCNMC